MLQTRPYGLVPPNLPALYPSGHGAYTVRSTRVFVSDFLQASIAGLPLSLTTLHLRQVGTGLCSALVSSYLEQHQQAAGPCPAHIGIGPRLSAGPSHTTQRTGPYWAIRLIRQNQSQGKSSPSDSNHHSFPRPRAADEYDTVISVTDEVQVALLKLRA